jgi:hypothetical protein
MKTGLAAIAFALLATAPAFADQPIATITASSLPDLPVGRPIGDGEQIYLPAEASLSLLFRDGSRRTLNGPMFGVVLPVVTLSVSESPYLMLGHDAGVTGASRTVQSARAPRFDDLRVVHAFRR